MDPNFQFGQIQSNQLTTSVLSQSTPIPPPLVVQTAVPPSIPPVQMHSTNVQTLSGNPQQPMHGLQNSLNSGAHQALFSILKGLDLPNLPQAPDTNITEQRIAEAQRQLRQTMDMNQPDPVQEEIIEPRGYPGVVQLPPPEPINIQVNQPQVGLAPIQLPQQIVTAAPQQMPYHQQMQPIMPQVGDPGAYMGVLQPTQQPFPKDPRRQPETQGIDLSQLQTGLFPGQVPLGQLGDYTITTQTTSTAPAPMLQANPVHLLQTVNVINANISELLNSTKQDTSFVVNQQQPPVVVGEKRSKEPASDTKTLAKKNDSKIEILRSRFGFPSPEGDTSDGNQNLTSISQRDGKRDKQTMDTGGERSHQNVRERSPVSQTNPSKDKKYQRSRERERRHSLRSGESSAGSQTRSEVIRAYAHPTRYHRDRESHGSTLSRRKQYHVFVSHSTADFQWAKVKVVMKLRNLKSHHVSVVASYHFRPDGDTYNQQAIRASMEEASIILLGLSQTYLNSDRCAVEWKLGAALAEKKQATVIMGAVKPCSRPEPLKKLNLMYLDFVDPKKESVVWKVLVDTIANLKNQPHDSVKDNDSSRKHKQKETKIETETITFATKKPYQRDPLGLESSPSRSKKPSPKQNKQVKPLKPAIKPYREELADADNIPGASIQESQGILDEPVSDEDEPFKEKLFDAFADRVEDDFEKDYEGVFSKEAEIFQPSFTPISPEEAQVYQEQDLVEGWGKKKTKKLYRKIPKPSEEELSEGEVRSESDESEYEEIEVTDNSDLEPEIHTSPLPSPPNSPRDRISSMECEPTEAPISNSVEEKMETSDIKTESSISPKQEVKSPETAEVKSGSEISPEFGGYPVKIEDNTSEVKQFYNKNSENQAELKHRVKSNIVTLRNFNNWVKSVLIQVFLRIPYGAEVLDMACGKGGDLKKWGESHIGSLLCVDLSDNSIEKCRGRYEESNLGYRAEFLVADCTRTQLRLEYERPHRFHMSSCQFAIHYAFESFSQSHMMLRNLCEDLRPGGYLIGTTVDANVLVQRLRESRTSPPSFGNKFYRVQLDEELSLDSLPLFGAKYLFKLDGVVDAWEYLVYLPLLIKMLSEYGMECVWCVNFYDLFDEYAHDEKYMDLAYKMRAFDRDTGSISQEEWDIIGMYLAFVFRKRGPKDSHSQDK